MQLNQLNLGEVFEIEIDGKSTKTKLQDFVDNDKFAVSQPDFMVVTIEALLGEPVRFIFNRPDGLYSFIAVLQERIIKDNLRLCIFKVVSAVERSQRRKAYRLPIVLNAKISYFDYKTADKNPREIPAKTINLSEAGVLISSFEPVLQGTQCKFRFIADNTPFEINAEVLRIQSPKKKNEPYEIGLKFLDEPLSDRPTLRRYIIQTQILQHKLKKAQKEE